MMEKPRKLELVQRSLALRHKLKVHESMKAPETHDEHSLMMLTRWEIEDELKAIEELLAESRKENVARKRTQLEKAYFGPSAPLAEPPVTPGATGGAEAKDSPPDSNKRR